MDVDNLLLQFSCMGTTDKEELIKQMQCVVGWDISARTATFFLEMNNWNLQGAVGSYFDSTHTQNFPFMTLLREFGTCDDEIRVHPGTSFSKSWDIVNAGDDPWPAGCSLVFSSGKLMCSQDRFQIDSLTPGSRSTVRLDMIAPDQPGIYESKWRMATSTGSFFGEAIWIIVTVVDQSLNGLTQQLSSMSSISPASSSPQVPCNPFNNVRPSIPQNGISTNLDEDGNMLL